MQRLEREIDQYSSIRVVSVLGFDLFKQEAKKFLEKKLWYSQNEELELSIALALEKCNKLEEETTKPDKELLLDLAILILAILPAESCILLQG